MADDPPMDDVALSEAPPVEPPDTVISPIQFQRRDTASSKAASEGGSEKVDTCRICRSEGTPDEPLFYPCKCSGSIKFVHQECLMEWLSHSNKKHCELCKTPFRFTKLYDANMPQKLPWRVFVTRACWHVIQLLARGCRSLLVGFVWLALIPWLIRWVWRWFFWIADAAWARQAFIELMQPESSQQQHGQVSTIDSLSNTFQQLLNPSSLLDRTEGPLTYAFVNAFAKHLGFGADQNSTSPTSPTSPDPSILSSWTYLANLTPSAFGNRVILDIFEGQIITCVIITGFILVFLIREWVVQQQPLVNLENLGNVQQQLRDAAERVQADNERLRRQQDLLEQARRRLIELQNETEGRIATQREVSEATKASYVGWENLEHFMDHATECLRKGATDRDEFLTWAERVTRQIRAAGSAGVDLDDFTNKVYEKLASYSDSERKEWEVVLASEIEKAVSRKRLQNEQSTEEPEDTSADAEGSSDLPTRPPMPERDFSSRATNIQRLLEEADAVFNGPSSTTDQNVSRNLNGEASIANGSAIPPSESPAEMQTDDEGWVSVPIPITNAGPDAKINIKRSGKGKLRAVPEPKIEEKMLEGDEAKRKLEDEITKELEEEVKKSPRRQSSSEGDRTLASEGITSSTNTNNPFHPDGPEPERTDSESFSNRVASVFREEFGLDEADGLENFRQAGVRAEESATEEERSEETQPQQRDGEPRSHIQRLADWFWGDIQTDAAQEAVPAPGEELQQAEGENEAPFAPVPAVVDVAPPPPLQPANPHHDPEVVAAAAQAGLDAEAIEDAEDLEGIFELIGLQGPLIGLFQTSAFCTLLVGCTIILAVIVPYIGGKLVLNLIGSPVFFLIKMPLQAASFIADFVVDFTLLIGGWSVMLPALAADFLLSAAQAWAPSLGASSIPEKIMEYALTIASDSGARLQRLFTSSEPSEGPVVEALAVSWAFLGSSIHAHASLRTLQEETQAVLDYASAAVTWAVETISTRSILEIITDALIAVANTPRLLAKVPVGVEILLQYAEPTLNTVSGLRKGSLTFSKPVIPLDTSLVYWNSWDRTLAIFAGYTALAALAAVYVAVDTPITRSESGRKTEKMIRDTLRQAGGVLKVILIISIEMLVFPLYCGILLDIAFLPLFRGASMASRWSFAGRHPYSFCFMHWFVGTCYMFHFALFVGMCRKILRKGVLWFIRDPDDPTFHPVRDVLERNVATQLRKIAFSALVYGALVILCLGGVIWSIGHVFDGIFPIHWVSTEPILEFPLDLFLYNFVTPLVIRLFKPSDAVNAMYAWWLRRCARVLRLSHFLFDDRRKDEEGHLVRKSWSSFLLMKKPDVAAVIALDGSESSSNRNEMEVYFERDGKYVLTPCNDQYRPPKPGEAFLYADDDDVYIADKDGKKNDHFSKVYVPPLFRVRITLFMVCLWIFSAITGLCATLVPLTLGRHLFTTMMPGALRVNDIYAYSVGAYILGGAMFAALKGRAGLSFLKHQATKPETKAWLEPAKRITLRLFKCIYVYGFIGVVLPILFALVLQFYFILPLHTWLVSVMAASEVPPLQAAANATDATSTVWTDILQSHQVHVSSLAEHTIHILQDYALGLLYVRIASRLVISAPTSKAAEAFRRITADGYLNPNARLATRFLVLPVVLLTAFMLLLPPLIANTAIQGIEVLAPSVALDDETVVKLYRYSYPVDAGCVVLMLALRGVGRATSKWRARIRDEVYLVGERLHNFGEQKPPVGSKSVVRKER